MKQIINKKISSLFAWLGILATFLFVFFFILATFIPSSQSAIDQNISGWGWSPLLSNYIIGQGSGFGFTSFNDCYCTYNPQTGYICLLPPDNSVCVSDKGGLFGAYGLQANLQTREITGWAWNQGVGWICFGESCCNAGGGQNYCGDWQGDEWEPNNVDPVSKVPQIKVTYEPDKDPAKISGWAKIVAATSTVGWGKNGWISLRGNINDGSGNEYGLRFSTSTLEIRGLAWNAFDTGTGISDDMPYNGFGWLCINEYHQDGYSLCRNTGVNVSIPYIQTVDGNIYSRTNISSDLPPPSGKFNATYLIMAGGNIQNFTSSSGDQYVLPNFPFDISLPQAGTNYFNVLGKLDIPRIVEPKDNRYGIYESHSNNLTIAGMYNNPNHRVIIDGDLILGNDPEQGTYTYNLINDWQLISIVTEEMNGAPIAKIFANVDGDVYIYEDTAKKVYNFEKGKGYWFKNKFNESVQVSGTEINSITYRLVGATLYSIGAPFNMNLEGIPCITDVRHYDNESGNYYTNFNIEKGKGAFVYTASTALCQFTKNRSDLSVKYSGGATTFVINGDLHINQNVIYDDSVLVSNFKNLPSIAYIVFGDVIIDPDVTQVDGNFIVLGKDGVNCPQAQCGTIKTGAGNYPLRVNGIMMAKKFEFERTYATVLKDPAEQIIYDGRLFVNTPPGLQDFSKSLPVWSQVIPK